ncbi:hypothetical protein MKW94_025576, partial [Papaver nudicaule]|nr:hypothetical protein [Papaver nudicaule]
MRNLKVWEKSCHLLTMPSHHHSKRYGSSILVGFGFILGASIIVLTAIIFIIPSLMDSMFWVPNAHTSSSSSTTTSDTASISALPLELLENSYRNSSVVSTDLVKDGANDDLIAANSDGKCDIFEGEWVQVNGSKPYYPPGSCPYLKKQPFACYENGRPDDHFLRWQWQWQWQWPSQETDAGCNDIPNPG